MGEKAVRQEGTFAGICAIDAAETLDEGAVIRGFGRHIQTDSGVCQSFARDTWSEAGVTSGFALECWSVNRDGLGFDGRKSRPITSLNPSVRREVAS